MREPEADFLKEIVMKKFIGWVVPIAVLALSGCSSQSSETASDSKPTAPENTYLVASEPAGKLGVIEAREKSKDQEAIVVIGRIGGSENPWVDGRAAFSIVDASLQSCIDVGCEDCEKPWDFC